MNLTFLEELLGSPIHSHTPVYGGDIATSFKVVTPSNNNYFIKTAAFSNALKMFEAEAAGLELLAASKQINIPEVFHVHQYDSTAYLILEFVETKTPGENDMECLGHALARLHASKSAMAFGWASDNFIGRLAQSNKEHSNWTDFYIQERILPQIQSAVDSHLFPVTAVPASSKMEKVCTALFGEIHPSLLHGDLWGGNYLISTDGVPYLIDPAVYYGHNEMDLAMTKLFGGFSARFYAAYHEIIAAHANQKALTDLYQLYYLLVHLNLFGTSYWQPVKRILTTYFV